MSWPSIPARSSCSSLNQTVPWNPLISRDHDGSWWSKSPQTCLNLAHGCGAQRQVRFLSDGAECCSPSTLITGPPPNFYLPPYRYDLGDPLIPLHHPSNISFGVILLRKLPVSPIVLLRLPPALTEHPHSPPWCLRLLFLERLCT